MTTSIIDQIAPVTKEDVAAIGNNEPIKDDAPSDTRQTDTVTIAKDETDAATVEVKTEAKKADVDEDKGTPVVPLQALREARDESRRAKDEARALREQMRKMETTWAEMQKRLTDKPPEKEPTLEDDPVGFIKRQEQRTRELQETLAKKDREAEESAQRNATLSQFQRAVVTAEQSFRKESADYDDAVEFAKKSRREDLMEVGMSEDEANQVLTGEVLFIAETALRNGRSPAQAMYNLAKKWGYKASKAPATNIEKATAKVEQIKEGKKATSGQSGADGDAPSGDMSIERLAGLEGAAFDKAFDKMFGGGRKGSDIFG